MLTNRQQYMKLKNDYDDLFEKYVLCRKIALQLVHREECIEKNQTFCHICDKNYSCPTTLLVHLQSRRHLNNVKSYCQN